MCFCVFSFFWEKLGLTSLVLWGNGGWSQELLVGRLASSSPTLALPPGIRPSLWTAATRRWRRYLWMLLTTAWVFLLMRVPTWEVASFYCPELCFVTILDTFALGCWLHAHILVVNPWISSLYICLIRKLEQLPMTPHCRYVDMVAAPVVPGGRKSRIFFFKEEKNVCLQLALHWVGA